MNSVLQRLLLNGCYGKPRSVSASFDPRQIRKVLLIRRNGIGDMICALPLIRNLRQGWPEVQLDILASERNACVLDQLGLVNRVFLYRRGKGIFRNHYLNLPRLLAPIRKEQYDLLITIKAGFSPLLAVISYATHIPWRLGYVPSRGHSLDFCFNLQVELPVEREHQVESCLRLLKPLGVSQSHCNLGIQTRPQHEQFAEECLRQAGLCSNSFVLFNASSERHESRWTPAAIAETAQELEKNHQLPMLLCGLRRDHDFLEEIRKNAASSIRWVTEPPTLHDFAALVRRSRFLMCGDGGPMHVAAAMKTPVFVLFSATDPNIWRPYQVPFSYIQRGRLVSALTPDEVLAKIRDWLPLLPQPVA